MHSPCTLEHYIYAHVFAISIGALREISFRDERNCLFSLSLTFILTLPARDVVFFNEKPLPPYDPHRTGEREAAPELAPAPNARESRRPSIYLLPFLSLILRSRKSSRLQQAAIEVSLSLLGNRICACKYAYLLYTLPAEKTLSAKRLKSLDDDVIAARASVGACAHVYVHAYTYIQPIA